MAEDIETILERSTITFPRPIAVEEVEMFILAIARKLNVEINYAITKHNSASRTGKTFEYFRLNGSITRNYVVASFELIDNKTLASSIESADQLHFSTIPGYRVEEHSPEEVQIWDVTRKAVTDYFAQTH